MLPALWGLPQPVLSLPVATSALPHQEVYGEVFFPVESVRTLVPAALHSAFELWAVFAHISKGAQRQAATVPVYYAQTFERYLLISHHILSKDARGLSQCLILFDLGFNV